MELGPLQAPELLTAVDPLSRGPPQASRPPGRDPGAGSALAPFELLLQLLGNRLPAALPGGKTLPQDGALPAADPLAPDPDAPATPLDVLAADARPPALPLPPLAAPPAPAAAAALAGVADAQTALAAAVRLAFAGAPHKPAALPPTVSSAADTTTAALAATGTDAPAAAPTTPQAEAGAAHEATPAELDALLALDPGTRAAAQAAGEPPTARSRAAPDGRARAPGATAAERALSVALALARADASAQPHADTAPPRAFDLQASAAAVAAAATGLLKAPRLGEPFESISAAGGSSTGFASLAPQGPSAAANGTAAQPNAQLPAHLGAPVDANAARWHEALTSRIQWLVDHEIGEAQIKLNPPELGALDVKISMLDDKTYVQMTAHTSAARDELSQSLPRLRELLSASGLDLGGATVSGGRDDRSGYQAAAQPAVTTRPSAPDSVELLADPPRLRLPSASRIDLFA